MLVVSIGVSDQRIKGRKLGHEVLRLPRTIRICKQCKQLFHFHPSVGEWVL